MRRFRDLAVVFVCLGMACSGCATWSAQDTVRNPMSVTYTDALVHLKVDLQEGTATDRVVVTRDGEPAAHQIDERGRLWVAVTLEPMASATYSVTPGKPEPQPAADLDPAVLALVEAALGADARVVSDGPLFRRWRVDHDAGGSTTVTLAAGEPYARVVDTGAGGLSIDLDPDFKATQGLMRRWHNGPFQGVDGLEEVPLDNGATRVPGGIINLQPRWTQGYDEAWFFAATDGRRMVGVLPLRAGLRRWPHDCLPTVRVDPDSGVLLDGAMQRGQRYYLLLAGPRAFADQAHQIARIEGFAPLDKLHHDYVFGPFKDGEKPAGIADFYSNQTNPTGMLRRMGRSAVKEALAGKTRTGVRAAYDCQSRFDPDWYGRYEHGWSPINPNFYTDFIKLPIAQAAMLRNDPSFEHVRQLAEDALRSDITHSVTLPGGAGQECPGYQAHAAHQWEALRPVTKRFLGFDPATWPRWKANGQFILHSSPPNGAGQRTFHPGGDTHPGRPDPTGFAKEFGYSANPRSFVTEELPGFGVIFRHQPGTANETFLAFKAGPNRGHYHGDQLSFHLCFDAKPAAVDHHASYKPRPGQEHMHNRLSFSTDDMPFANMDGYERLIAFKTSDAVDVAVAQVESPRLRKIKELPPEDWDDDIHQRSYDTPLVYRRTIVFVKQAADPETDLPIRPFFVIRDQYEGPELDVTHNLHAVVVRPQNIEPTLFKWEHENGGLEQTVNPRITQTGSSVEFVTVLFPGTHQPAVKVDGDSIRVGDTVIGFGLGLPDNGSAVSSKPRVLAYVLREGVNGIDLRLEDAEVDLNRPQGDIGLFVPDVGYPFGPIPDWLIEQRGQRVVTEEP